MYDTFRRIDLDNDAVLAQLLLHEDDFLRAFDNEVSSRIERALCHSRQLRLGPASEHALVAPEHDGETADVHVRAPNDILAARVLDRDEDRGAVRGVPQPALVRGNALIDRVGVGPVREADYNVCVLEPEARVDVRGYLVIGLQDVLDVDVDEVVEGLDVLFDETFHFEKSG